MTNDKPEAERLAEEWLRTQWKWPDHGDEFDGEDMQRAFVRGSAAGQPKWIAVAERMPEFGQEVLIAAKDTIAIAYRWSWDDERGNWRWQDSDTASWAKDSVTHWMPLPEPPK